MPRRVKFAVAVAIFLVAALSLPADPTVNPNHPVYDALAEWHVAGLVHDLPAFQPYPEHELVRLLEAVEARGGPAERARAAEFLELLRGSFNLRGWSVGKLFTQNDDFQPKAGQGLSANGSLGDSIGYGGELGIFAIERGAEDLLPEGERAEEDILEDNAKISVAGRDVHTLFQLQSQGVWYSDSLMLQAGIMRRSYGPFHAESPVVSKESPQSANFLFEWRESKFRFTAALFSLTAQQLFRELETTDASAKDHIDLGGLAPNAADADFNYNPKSFPGKHMMLHAVHYRLFPWLRLGLFESVIFGPRLELAYFVPFTSLFYAQGVSAFFDNSLLGFSADIKPARRWRIPVVLYVDDADFNDIVSFNFDDAKFKLAGAAAVQWAPRTPVVRSASVSYEAVMPYMYTHSTTNPYTTEPNYLNYLHQGENLGVGLLPNSDRLKLEADFAATGEIGFGVRGALIRHGNASEGVLDQLINDGGYADAGKEGEFIDVDGDGLVEWIPGDLTYNSGTRFLTQDHIELTYQAGADLSFRFETGALDWDISTGYTFEYVDGKIDYLWDESSGPGGGRTVSLGDEINHFADLQLRVSY